jgi:hypothetical protein
MHGAAPHLPAGIFSPYRDGEKFAGRSAGTNFSTWAIGEIINEIKLLPVSIRGEGGSSRMKGSRYFDG